MLGDEIISRIQRYHNSLFDLGEAVQLSFVALEDHAQLVEKSKDEVIKISFPLGLDKQGIVMPGERTYKKQDMARRYRDIAHLGLPVSGIYNLVTLTEVAFTDILTSIIKQFPRKLGEKRTLAMSSIFDCTTLDAVRQAAILSYLNELAYKSPREFAESVENIFSFNILELPPYHRYIEMKATRDIYIHNQGWSNAIYKSKASSLARVKLNEFLPIDVKYFLECYEYCNQLAEALQEEFHKVWPSPMLEAQRREQAEKGKQMSLISDSPG